MIHLVTGKINSGKTTKIIDLYNKNRIGDGFACVKKMQNQNVHSYSATKLSNQQSKVFMIHQNYYDESFKDYQKIGPYIINKETITWIEKEISTMLEENVNPIYLDEIAQLELSGQGFDSIIKTMVSSKTDLVFVVRENLIKEVINHYQLKNIKLIKMK